VATGTRRTPSKIRRPKPVPDVDESLEFHAARLLLLIYYIGGAKRKQIEGRTKLAKLDFLVRYPTYLLEAARIKGVQTDIVPTAAPESPMIRYKYGPWDTRYYDVLALMVAKDLLEIESHAGKGDIFCLTGTGEAAVRELQGPEFEEIAKRCKLAAKLFGHVAGSTIKDFIYRYFTEVLDRPLGAEIEGYHV
jgi:hypothetical protein